MYDHCVNPRKVDFTIGFCNTGVAFHAQHDLAGVAQGRVQFLYPEDANRAGVIRRKGHTAP